MKKDREKKQKYSNITDATIMGSTSEESVLYASANKEHLAILDDKTLGRTLEGISKYKVNPKYQYQNINQQAGYSAEIKEQAQMGMLLLTRSRRVNLWVKTVRSVLKNSHPKVMRNILKMA